MSKFFLFEVGDKVCIKTTGKQLVVVDCYQITTRYGEAIPVYRLSQRTDDVRKEWYGVVYGEGELEAVGL